MKFLAIRLSILALGLVFLPNLLSAQTQTTGVAEYGTWPANGNYAVFGHDECVSGSDYALLQQKNCQTFLNTGAGQRLHFRVGNVEKMTLNANGRLGIGVVGAADKLHIHDATHPSLRLSGSGYTSQISVATGNGFYSPKATPGDLVMRNLNADVQLYSIAGDISMVTGSGGAAAERMIIKNDGKVGIGRTPLARKLEVEGEVYFDGAINFGGGNVARIVPDGAGVSYHGRSFGGDYVMVRHQFLNNQVNIGYNPRNFVPGGWMLTVDGNILAEGITIQNSNSWPDYVFEEDYELRDLEEVEAFVNEHKHLPEVPSAKDVEDGVSVGDMQKVLLKKVEELTLYVIDQDKKLDELQTENASLKDRIIELEQ